jgi:hypothetical protein
MSDKDEINRLLWRIDVEMRRLIDVVEGPVFSALRRTRLYQATLTQRWVDMGDTSRDRESNTVKTLAEVAAELGVGYLEHTDSETDEALGEKLA